MEDVYHLRVIPAPCSSCEPFDLEVDPALTWDELRESLELYSGIAPEQQHIVYKGSILRPERIDCAATLHALGFRDHTKLYLSSNTTRNSLSSSRESSAGTTSEARSELTHNAFRHTGSGASSSARNDEFPRFMNRNRSPLEPDAFSPMASIPPQLQESFIDLLVSNPELMENLLQSNPQTRSLLRNPTLARELRDPNTLRDMLRASFTPQAREDMARSVELRMSHLSNMGGEAFMNSAFAEMVRSEEEGRWEDADEVDGRRLTPEEIQMRDEAVEAQTQPQAGRGSNTDPMPNPWAPAARAPDRSLRSGPEELFRGLLARQTPPEERPSHVSSHSDVWTALPLSAYSSLLRTASTPGEMPPSSPNAMGLMHHLFQNLTLQGERSNTGQPQQQNTPGESPSGIHSTPTVAGETLQEQVFGHFSAPPARNGEVRPLPRVGGDQVDSPPQRNARDDEPNEGIVPASSGLESQGATGEAEKKDSPGPADPKVEK